MIERNRIIIYPEYFDIKISRSEGRRVPKELAIEKVDSQAIYKACKQLGYRTELDLNSSHSGYWFNKRGRVLIEKGKKTKKTKVLKNIAKILSP